MSTREAVLEFLVAADGFISGTTMAGRLGISRVAVGKHVDALRAAGYVIEARKSEGYHFVSLPRDAVPAGVAPLLRSTFWTRVEGGESTTSTNDDARVLARAGALEGTAVVAASQTQGRGRLGRVWSSPSGGAYMSVVLRPSVAPFEVGTLGLAVGVGVARALEALGVDAWLKWPNDVLVDGRKVAGILLEMSAEADRIEWVVAGVGLNVCRSDHAPADASYVSDHIPGVSPAIAAAAVLDGIADAYLEWRSDGFASMRGAYEARNVVTGTSVTVRAIDGSVLADGVAEGVDDGGRLLVRDGDGVRAMSAGDVTLRD